MCLLTVIIGGPNIVKNNVTSNEPFFGYNKVTKLESNKSNLGFLKINKLQFNDVIDFKFTH